MKRIWEHLTPRIIFFANNYTTVNFKYYIYLYKTVINMQKTILHSPTLESILMVEKAAKKYSGMYGKYQLWNKLPKKMMYQTFQTIIDYLQESNKIIIEDNKIIWIWDPEGIRKLIEKGLVIK